MNVETVKIYCSENLLYYIIKFTKLNQLVEDEVKEINDFLRK